MIVMDASTAILLAKAELLDEFIQAVAEPVVMPREVEEECCSRDSPDAWSIKRAVEERRIRVKTVERKALIGELGLEFTLGTGEAAVLALATGHRGVLVATDDKRAINACKLLRIPFTTALSVLVRMREKGALSSEEALEKLETLAAFGRYRKDMVEAARAQLE